MSVLDSSEFLASRDPSGALRALAGMPGQVSRAADAVGRVALPMVGEFDSVLVCGMGGSGVGGDALAACAESSPVPVVVRKSYGVPSFVGPRTFVLASSYSGSTEETVDAMRAAVARGARGLAVALGDPLASESAGAGWAVVRPDAGLMPRYALGWMAGAPIAAMSRTGLIDLPEEWGALSSEHLDACAARWGPEAPTQDNVAKSLAHELLDTLPVVWGGDGVSACAAVRWKTDLNENAKTFAHAACLPEADHHEIVAFAREGREGRPAVKRVLVLLREPDEDQRVAARFVETAREVSADFDLVWSYEARSPDRATRFFEFALLGGFVSCYLALLRGVDPTPIPSIARLKAALDGRAPRGSGSA